MQNMRQLAIDALPLLLQGGISNYVGPLAKHLVSGAGEKWRVDLVFRMAASCSRLESYRRYCREHHDRPAGHRRIFIPDRWITRLWENGYFIPLRRRGESPGIFLATTGLVPRLKPGANGAVGWIVYDLIPLKIPGFFTADVETFTRLARERANRADFIIAISETTRRDVIDILKYPESKVCVIYPGVARYETALNAAPLLSPAARPYIFYSGSLALNKNVDGLIRVFARCIHRHHLDLDLVLSGKDFCGRGYWRQLVRDEKLEGRVHITGWVSDRKRDALLANAMMAWQFSWYEGFGLSILEAASMGIPVLYSNRGAAGEILCNPEQEIDPADEEAAADKAAAACRSPEVLLQWKKHGLARAAKYSWEKSAEKLLDWCARNAG